MRMPAGWIGILFLVSTGAAGAYSHQHGPVRWQEYSEAAFARARAENKPVFMVVSAVWCFNCKIYEETSLADPRVARLLNEGYVPVFVDYDRRPDIARRYPATGIPVTVVFAPDGAALVSVPGVIEADRLVANLRRTLEYVREEYRPEARPQPPGPAEPATPPSRTDLEGYRQAFGDILWGARDPAFGGFGLAQKEPRAEALRRLLERFRAGEARWGPFVQTTLDHILGRSQKVARGRRPPFQALLALRASDTERLDEVDALQTEHMLAGLYDPAEGGFFRYATRRDWTVPHFEKMLFDNAALIDLLLAAHTVWPDRGYLEPALASARYVARTLFDPGEGRFLGSQVADEVYYHLTAEERRRTEPPAVDRTTYAASSARAAIALL
ncbi:MAG: thioredoxin domain-containing protein, partial [Deltaproteobacteria bacterium]|nr:thioredoxin domain-containing protein [Deltaproteobacteria bacterium]